MFQTKEQDKTPEEQVSEVDISNLPDKVFKVMVIKMVKGLRKRLDEQSKNIKVLNEQLENIKKNQTEMKNKSLK